MGQPPLHTGSNVAGGPSKRPHPLHICEFIPGDCLGFPGLVVPLTLWKASASFRGSGFLAGPVWRVEVAL